MLILNFNILGHFWLEDGRVHHARPWWYGASKPNKKWLTEMTPLPFKFLSDYYFNRERHLVYSLVGNEVTIKPFLYLFKV